jgi:polyhydroxyalkanoate synthesis regulator phasin
MTQDEKARLYDDLLRAGDVIRAKISKLKANTIYGMTPEDEQTLANLKQQLTNLEHQVQRLIT